MSRGGQSGQKFPVLAADYKSVQLASLVYARPCFIFRSQAKIPWQSVKTYTLDATAILVVEDNPIIAADLADRLSESGYHVLGPVAAGEDALPFFLQKTPPDLVLMDIQLEGEWDGIETTRRIRQQHDLPVIFLNSNSDDATFRQARAVNPQAFFVPTFPGPGFKARH